MPRQHDHALPSWLEVSTGPPAAGATTLSGPASRDRAGLFVEWATRLAFPGYFGHNWDAFEDCLADLVAQQPRRLAVTDAAELLADEPPRQLGILLAVLGTVAEPATGKPAGPSLRVILLAAPAGTAALWQRLRSALPDR